MRKTLLFLIALPFLVLAAGILAYGVAEFGSTRQYANLVKFYAFLLPSLAALVWARLFSQTYTIYVVGVVLHLSLVGLGPVGGALAVYTALDRGETDPGRLAGAVFFAALGLSCAASGLALWRLGPVDDQAEWALSSRTEARIASWLRAVKELFSGARLDFSRANAPKPAPRASAPPAEEPPATPPGPRVEPPPGPPRS
jgi:hypothetical protein